MIEQNNNNAVVNELAKKYSKLLIIHIEQLQEMFVHSNQLRYTHDHHISDPSKKEYMLAPWILLTAKSVNIYSPKYCSKHIT